MQDDLFNAEGFLVDHRIWNESFAIKIAQRDELELTKDHWHIINFVRSFYFTYENLPTVRMLVKELSNQVSEDKANSIYLHQLFPQGVIKQACKIAGLPKPARCI